MKLKLSILAVALFSANLAHALSFGVMAGNRFESPTFVSANPLVTTMTATVTSSYQGGAYVGFTLLGPAELTLGLLYKARSTDVRATIIGTASGETMKDTVYDIPLRLQISLPMGLYFKTGITYSSVQTSVCSGAFGNMACPVGTFRTADDVLATIGAGYKFVSITKFSLALEGLYNYGLRDMGSGSGVSGWSRGIEANLVAGFSI